MCGRVRLGCQCSFNLEWSSNIRLYIRQYGKLFMLSFFIRKIQDLTEINRNFPASFIELNWSLAPLSVFKHCSVSVSTVVLDSHWHLQYSVNWDRQSGIYNKQVQIPFRWKDNTYISFKLTCAVIIRYPF